MNGNLNMMNMAGMNMNIAGLNNNQQAMAAMIQNQNFAKPLLQQQQAQQGQGAQPLFNQNPQAMQFAAQQQRLAVNPAANQINGQMNGIPSQLNHQQLLAQQQLQQQAQQQQQQRQGLQRQPALQINTAPGQMSSNKVAAQFNPTSMMSAPNSAPLPTSNSSAGNSQGHTPQMGNQSQPSQFNPQLQSQAQTAQKLNGAAIPSNVTPILSQQQQPTPQSQPRAGPPPVHQTKPNVQIPGQVTMPIQGTSQSPMQKQPMTQTATGQGIKNPEQEQFQHELHAKIFKRNLGNAGVIRILDLMDQISNESVEYLSTVEYWQRVIQLYFLPTSILRFTTAPTVTLNSNENNINNNNSKVNTNSDINSNNMNNNVNNNVSNNSRTNNTIPINNKIDNSSKSNGNNINNENNNVNNSNNSNFNNTNSNSFLDGKNRVPRQFELTTSTAPRFFTTNILTGNIAKFSLSLSGLKFQVMNNGAIFIISRLSVQYMYNDGSILNVTGSCKILMNREFRIEWIDFHCLNNQSSISFASLDRRLRNFIESTKSVDPQDKNITQEFLNHLYETSDAIKSSPNSGIHENAMGIMQVGDIMSSLKSLMGFSIINNVSSPIKALELFMTANNNQQAALAAHAQAQAAAQAQIQAAAAAQRKNSGLVSSPSPHTIHSEDPKTAIKKRKLSTSLNSSVGSHLAMDNTNGPNKRRK